MSQNKLINLKKSFSFDDVLVVPRMSSILPSEVNLSVKLNEKLTLQLPIISAAMDTVTEYEMSRAMIVEGGCGPLHKNLSFDLVIESIKKLRSEFGENKPYAVAIGVTTTDQEIKSLIAAGVNVMIVDSAHGHSKNVGEKVEWISKNYSDIFIIAGNVVTKEGAEFLISKGANAVKVGIGPGSICITRKVTGVGMGQLTAICDVSEVCKKHGVLLVADGGIRSNDEIMKSISAGADLVMLGYMLAGTDQSPGEIIVLDNKEYKLYRGMGCMGAMEKGSSERYNKGNLSNEKWMPEGIESYIKAKGNVVNVLFEIAWSLRSAFGYVGCKNITDVHNNVEFVKISNSVLKKSDSHSIDRIIITKK